MGCTPTKPEPAKPYRVTGGQDKGNVSDRKINGTKPNSNDQNKVLQNKTPNKIQPSQFVVSQTGQFSDRYIRDKKLGSGAYGEVLLCRDKTTGFERAVKIIKKSTVVSSADDILDEVELVKRLDHPNIMKLFEFFDDKRNFYMVMELYTGGELFDEIISRQRFSEEDAAGVIKQIISGVTYLHKHHIVHRDLKPENLLLQYKGKDAPIKIVDFGLSAFFDPTIKMKDRLGTLVLI